MATQANFTGSQLHVSTNTGTILANGVIDANFVPQGTKNVAWCLETVAKYLLLAEEGCMFMMTKLCINKLGKRHRLALRQFDQNHQSSSSQCGLQAILLGPPTPGNPSQDFWTS